MEKQVGFDFEQMPDTELDIIVESLEKLLDIYLKQNEKVGQQN